MAIRLISDFPDVESLLGERQGTIYASGQASGISALSVAFLVNVRAIDVGSVGAFRLRFVGPVDYLVPIYKWTNLVAAAAGDTLTENGGTGLRVYDTDGKWILVGRTNGNQVLVQNGTYDSDGGAAFGISIHTVEYLGGFLDHRIDSVGTRHRLCMQARSASVPSNPGSPHYSGRSIRSITTGGVTWNQAGLYTEPGTDTLYFAFGEAVYSTLRGRWVVQQSWRVVDATDSADIQYGPSWVGPWSDPPYAYGTHEYARVRLDDGSFAVYKIGPEATSVDRAWRLLTETYIDGDAALSKPYTTRTGIDFHPTEWRQMKVTFDWEAFSDTHDGVVYYDRSHGFLDPSDILVAPIGVRSESAYEPRTSGRSWLYIINRLSDIRIGRNKASLPSGSSSQLVVAVQWEGDASGNLPITHFRVIRRTTASSGITGWLRHWIL